MNIEKFDGYVLTCPLCNQEQYIRGEDLTFDPTDDLVHIITCFWCEQDFEVSL
jgi:transcription elongation factor Elf1